jgi:hypothetical protein
MLQLGLIGRALALAALLASPPAFARGGGGYGHSSGSHHGWSSSYAHASSNHPSAVHETRSSASGVERDSRGKIKRDPAQKRAFESHHPCPSTGKTSGACPGYVVDHVKPLKHGGKDNPSNMQWQTQQAAKEKDRWE